MGSLLQRREPNTQKRGKGGGPGVGRIVAHAKDWHATFRDVLQRVSLKTSTQNAQSELQAQLFINCEDRF